MSCLTSQQGNERGIVPRFVRRIRPQRAARRRRDANPGVFERPRGCPQDLQLCTGNAEQAAAGALCRTVADVHPTFAAVAAAQSGAFTREQALRDYTPDQVRARLSNGQWVRVFQGVYRRRTAVPSPRLRTVAAGLSLNRPATACLHTAAQLHGFGVLDDFATHVVVAGPRRRPRPGLIVHSTAVSPADVCRHTGVSATCAARTAVDLARILPRPDGLAVLDAALHQRRVSPHSLQEELTRQSPHRGIVTARGLVAMADGKAESPMESRSRLRCIDGGLPPPDLQIDVRGGGRCHRLDMGWRKQKVGLEYDSLAFHGDHSSLRYDRERHNWLTAEGWTMVYATARQILSVPDELIAQISRALHTAA